MCIATNIAYHAARVSAGWRRQHLVCPRRWHSGVKSAPCLLRTGPNKLAICNDADCAAPVRSPIDVPGIIHTLQLLAGDRPAYASGTSGLGYISLCDDSNCATAQHNVLLSNSETSVNYQGSLGLDGTGAAFVAFEEQALADVLLAVPLPEMVFKNGFE